MSMIEAISRADRPGPVATSHDRVEALLDAARVRDGAGFVAAYVDIFGEPGDSDAVAYLLVRVAQLAHARADRDDLTLDVHGVHELALLVHPVCSALLEVNLAVLESLLRSTVGISDYLAVTDPRAAGLCLGAIGGALLSTADGSSDAATSTGAGPAPAQPAVDAAITAARRGDPFEWSRQLEAGLGADAVATVAAASAALAQRLKDYVWDEQPTISSIVAVSALIASAFDDTDFACGPYLIEFAIRKALNEPHCNQGLEDHDFVYAATQACGLLDAQAHLFPSGWRLGVLIVDD